MNVYEGIFTCIKTNNIENLKILIEDYIFYCKTEKFPNNRLQFLFECCLTYQRYDIFDLLTKYINVDIQDEKGNTILMNTICKNYVYYKNEDINFILNYVKDINKSDIFYNHTALYLYINPNTIHDIKFNLNKITSTIIKMLNLGADIFIRNYNGYSILDFAIKAKSCSIIELLLNNTKKERIINMEILRTICNLIDDIDNYDVVELLLCYVDDINEMDAGKNTIMGYIEYAKDDIDPNFIELLKVHGATSITKK